MVIAGKVSALRAEATGTACILGSHHTAFLTVAAILTKLAAGGTFRNRTVFTKMVFKLAALNTKFIAAAGFRRIIRAAVHTEAAFLTKFNSTAFLTNTALVAGIISLIRAMAPETAGRAPFRYMLSTNGTVISCLFTAFLAKAFAAFFARLRFAVAFQALLTMQILLNRTFNAVAALQTIFIRERKKTVITFLTYQTMLSAVAIIASAAVIILAEPF